MDQLQDFSVRESAILKGGVMNKQTGL